MAIYTPQPYIRNANTSGSFFAAQQENPTTNPLIVRQVDPTAPQITSLNLISNPISPTGNSQYYVSNFDPNLYDLRDTSHLMRFLRALMGSPGIGAVHKQYLIARLANSLSDGSFLDLDSFYGAIFGLQRHLTESMPTNLDGTVVNPYTDLANSDIWDEVLSRDAKYRSKLFQLARAVNMGGTYPGLKGVAESIVNDDVDIIESWVKTDFLAQQGNLEPSSAMTYSYIENQYVTYGNIKTSYGNLQGTQFGNGELPAGNRGELIFTPHRSITQEERYQLQQVLNTLKPANVQVTISSAIVESTASVQPRGYSSDSENWIIQSRVTPALNLVNPPIPVYNNAGPYSLARPVFSEYTGEQWSYNPNLVRAVSYQINGETQSASVDDQTIVFSDNTAHTYSASDGVRDMRQAIAMRLSGEGVVTNMPYLNSRSSYTQAT